MAYIHPSIVKSPKDRLGNVNVIIDKGEDLWAVAEVEWDGKSRMGVRWNGGETAKGFPGVGNPQSRGVPTWFILPDEIADLVRKNLKSLL